MTIRIELPKFSKNKNDIRTAYGTKVFNSDGKEIKDVTSIKMCIDADSILYATLEVAVLGFDNMDNIHALLGTKTLEEIASLHGYEIKIKSHVPLDSYVKHHTKPKGVVEKFYGTND